MTVFVKNEERKGGGDRDFEKGYFEKGLLLTCGITCGIVIVCTLFLRKLKTILMNCLIVF